VAHLILDADPAEASFRTRKRKRAPLVHVLKRRSELCSPGQFVASLPTGLPAGVYQIKMVSGSTSSESNSVPIKLDAPPGSYPARRSNQTKRTAHTMAEFAVPYELGAAAASNGVRPCWPERNSYVEELLPDEFQEPAPRAEPGSKPSLTELVPSHSEMTLSYIQPAAVPLSCQGLTRSVSEENIAKMEANNAMVEASNGVFGQLGLTRSESDFTRNLWMTESDLRASCEMAAVQLQQSQMAVEQEPLTVTLARNNSLSLCRQHSETGWDQYLVSEEIDPPMEAMGAPVVQSAA